ncbi:hypothetical protein F511_47145 [Dorcoceras hygrometricum]|uniref:Uncharacterized protein n=1 Tax=Dorcoceras hygrometricum TaxID=472368 RepID=A0A2Z6ZRS4_9LAMI|nr:hypothetical protein F511_47145 [Dorcoceras hygrometricum]
MLRDCAACGAARCASIVRRWPRMARDVGSRWARGRDVMLGGCRREFFLWWRRRRRPPLRRVSGDVVTAGPISSRVWFGPVPGSP